MGQARKPKKRAEPEGDGFGEALSRRQLAWDPEITLGLSTTVARKKAFLRAYSLNGTIGPSASVAGISRSSHFHWIGCSKTPEELKADGRFEEVAEYAEAFREAHERCIEMLEREMLRRAMENSDNIAMFLARANRPQKYNLKMGIEHSGKVDIERMVADSMEAPAKPGEKKT